MITFIIFKVTVAMVFVLGAMEAATIGTEFNEKSEPTDEEMAREIAQFLTTVQYFLFDPRNMTEFPGSNGYCTCEETHCRCCQRFMWKEFCVVLEHHSHSDTLELSLKCGNTKIISHSFSVKNNPPFCFPTHFIPGASVCLHLNDLGIAQGKVHACISISAKFWIIKKKFDLGCFNVIRNSEKMELAKVMKLTHEMAKQAERDAVWIEGDPIVAFRDVFSMFMAAGNIEPPLQDSDQK